MCSQNTGLLHQIWARGSATGARVHSQCARWWVPTLRAIWGGLTVPALFTFFSSPLPSALTVSAQLTNNEGEQGVFVCHRSVWHEPEPPREFTLTLELETKQATQRWRHYVHGWDLSVLLMWRFSKSVRCSVCLTRTQRGGTFLIDSFLAPNQSASRNIRLECAL